MHTVNCTGRYNPVAGLPDSLLDTPLDTSRPLETLHWMLCGRFRRCHGRSKESLNSRARSFKKRFENALKTLWKRSMCMRMCGNLVASEKPRNLRREDARHARDDFHWISSFQLVPCNARSSLWILQRFQSLLNLLSSIDGPRFDKYYWTSKFRAMSHRVQYSENFKFKHLLHHSGLVCKSSRRSSKDSVISSQQSRCARDFLKKRFLSACKLMALNQKNLHLNLPSESNGRLADESERKLSNEIKLKMQKQAIRSGACNFAPNRGRLSELGKRMI